MTEGPPVRGHLPSSLDATNIHPSAHRWETDEVI